MQWLVIAIVNVQLISNYIIFIRRGVLGAFGILGIGHCGLQAIVHAGAGLVRLLGRLLGLLLQLRDVLLGGAARGPVRLHGLLAVRGLLVLLLVVGVVVEVVLLVSQDGGGRDCALGNRLPAGSGGDRASCGAGLEEYARSHCDMWLVVRRV
jgi:hypothetical protein